MVLYTACQHDGAPECLISDSGGAYIAHDFEAVCTRLQIDHRTIVSTQGESYLNWIETHFNMQAITWYHDGVAQRITSSAKTRSVGGIVIPSAWAVLRLRMSSKCMGCSMGRSAGLAPFRILST